jgi:hypothetical protein
MMRRFQYILPVLLLGLAACDGPEQPVPMGTDTYFDGYINKGGKFGVRIGDSRKAAHTQMIKRHEFYEASDRKTYVRLDHETCDEVWQNFVSCKPGETFDYYRKRDLGRDGRVFIFFKDDKVTAIYWDTSLLGAIDL